MQGDLISRSALKELLIEALEKIKKNPTMTQQEVHIICASHMLGDMIDDAPAVDAVPVARCKDCKHRGGYNCPMYHTETSLDDLDGFDDYNVDKTDGDGFCHRGERRE